MEKKVGAMKTKRGGKEKVTDADDVSLKKVDCDWSKSTVKAHDLERSSGERGPPTIGGA